MFFKARIIHAGSSTDQPLRGSLWFDKRVVTAEKLEKILRCFMLSMKQFDKLMDV